MPLVPQLNFPEPPKPKRTTFFCFPRGTSQKDKQHDLEQINRLVERVKRERKSKAVPKCYDCRDACTKDYRYIDVRSEDGNLMRVAIHEACHERALHGGTAVYPDRKSQV